MYINGEHHQDNIWPHDIRQAMDGNIQRQAKENPKKGLQWKVVQFSHSSIASDNPIEIDQDNATISFQDFKVISGTLMQPTCNYNTKDKRKL